MFVHIVFKCINYKLCTDLGELPYLIYSTLIMISSFDQLVLRIFDCLLHSLKLSSPCYPFAIFDPQYSLTSSKYSFLDKCI